MKNDTISRAAALDALADYIHHVDKVIGTGHLSAYDCMDVAKSVLGEDELPSAQQWIMCSPDTTPKMTDIYLVKVRINQYGEGMYPTFRTALWHTASKKWFVHESENSIIGDVTAWMPIPWEGGRDA